MNWKYKWTKTIEYLSTLLKFVLRFDWFGCFKETILTFNVKQTERSTDLEV